MAVVCFPVPFVPVNRVGKTRATRAQRSSNILTTKAAVQCGNGTRRFRVGRLTRSKRSDTKTVHTFEFVWRDYFTRILCIIRRSSYT